MRLILHILFLGYWNQCIETTFAPNIAFNLTKRLQNGKQVTVSYMNMKKMEKRKLNVTPIKQLEVQSVRKCQNECTRTNGVCISFNVIKANKYYHCELLDKDIYGQPALLDSSDDSSHYVIVNECMKSSSCKEFYECIPNYYSNSYHCVFRPRNCEDVTKENKPPGYYDLTVEGSPRPWFVYCDTVTAGGNWMMVLNVSGTADVPSYYSYEELVKVNNGMFVIDGKHFKQYIHPLIPISEFRFFCSKPSHGRTIHVVASKEKPCGSRLVENLIGVTNENDYRDCSDAFHLLPDDNSVLNGAPAKLVDEPGLNMRYFFSPFLSQDNRFSAANRRRFCDDKDHSDGIWQVFIR